MFNVLFKTVTMDYLHFLTDSTEPALKKKERKLASSTGALLCGDKKDSQNIHSLDFFQNQLDRWTLFHKFLF